MAFNRASSDPWREWGTLIAGLALGFAAAQWTGRPATRVQAHGRGAVAAGAVAGFPGNLAPNPMYTVASIPELSAETRRRITSRLSATDMRYSNDKLAAGVNPFTPLTVERVTGPLRPVRGPRGEEVAAPAELRFWGVSRPGPGVPVRAVVEIDDTQQCWLGTIGEWVEGTDLRLVALDPDGRYAEFERIAGKPERIRIEAESDQAPSVRPAR